MGGAKKSGKRKAHGLTSRNRKSGTRTRGKKLSRRDKRRTSSRKKPNHPSRKPLLQADQTLISRVLAWGNKVSSPFREKVRSLCHEIQCDPNYLMAAMAFETNETFSPTIRNVMSGATGLIQFMPTTARGLDTTVEELAQMTAEEQLNYVERYFRPFMGRLQSLEDVYMAILWPDAVGGPSDTILFLSPSIQYTQNTALDSNGDGRVTKGEATIPVQRRLEKGLRPENAG